MAPVGWVCARCGARNREDLVRCRICATIRPGVSFGSSPQSTTAPPPPPAPPPSYAPPPFEPPQFESFESSTFVSPPPVGTGTGFVPPGMPPPTPIAPGMPPPGMPPPVAPVPGQFPPPVPPRAPDRSRLLVVGAVALVVVVAVATFVASRRTDSKAIADRDAADKAELSTSDIGGQWRLVSSERHAIGGRASVFIGQESCRAPNAVEISAEADRAYTTQQGAAIAVVGSSILVTPDTKSSASLFDDLRAVAQPCITGLLKKAGAGVSGFTVSVHEHDDLAVGDRAASFTGSAGVPGRGAAEVDALLFRTGRSVVLLLTVDTTGSIASKHFATWAQDVIVQLRAELPAR